MNLTCINVFYLKKKEKTRHFKKKRLKLEHLNQKLDRYHCSNSKNKILKKFNKLN